MNVEWQLTSFLRRECSWMIGGAGEVGSTPKSALNTFSEVEFPYGC